MRNNLAINRILIRNFITSNLNRNTVKETVIAENVASIKLNKNLQNIDSQKLTKLQEMYAEKLNAKNSERYLKEKRLKTHYRITGAILISIALSIYAYTMLAIRQEKFLDDFDEPVMPESVSNTSKTVK